MAAHIDREIAAHPDLVQIENGYRSPRDKKPDAVQRGVYREIEPLTQNPDAELVLPCGATRTALIVYGKRVGTTLMVCTDNQCPVHNPRAASKPCPVMPTSSPAETEAEAEESKQRQEQQRKEYEAEQERQAEQRRQDDDRRDQECEAQQLLREETRQARIVTFGRIQENVSDTLSAAQLRVLLRAIVNFDSYAFADDLAEEIADENEQRSAEAVLLATIDETADDKLTRFAVRLALTGHVGIPREDEHDFLAEADAVFVPAKPKKPIAINKPRSAAKKVQSKAAANPPKNALNTRRRA